MRKKLGSYYQNFRILNDKSLMFSVIDKVSGKRVGFISCSGEKETPDMHIGWVICKDQQGKGYATDAVKLLIQWVKKYLPEISELNTVIHLENKASMRVAEKVGMEKSGEVHKSRGMDAVWLKMIFA